VNADPTTWWRTAAIYQIYVRSFADADGDGLGDLEGIRSRLAYLSDLGIDAVWLTPFYPSPQADAGYDVADHRDVDQRFGNLGSFDSLLSEAHAKGIRVLIDLVPNHTSDRHRWFAAALQAAPGSPERSRYVFRDGRGPGGDLAPNDWQSVFGGAAWTRVPGDSAQRQWYLHLFAPEQPDLDWTNTEVRVEFESILRFWFDRGVDGFRIDVAHGLIKQADLPDIDTRYSASGPALAGHPHWDRDEVHDIYRRWRLIAEEYPGDRAFVAEAWVDDPQRLARYVRPDELHTAFNFAFLLAGWDAHELRDAIDSCVHAMAAVGAPPTWVLSNHDVVREVTRFGDGEQGVRRARAAALLLLSLPGSAYIYQGAELGLAEVRDLPDEARQDPTFQRTDGAEVGRDGCRVPLPWSGDEPPYGFGPGQESWLPQPADWKALSVERQLTDPGSMLTLYRTALRLRAETAVAADHMMEWIETGPDMLAFRRGEGLACLVNVGDEPVDVPESLRDAEILLTSAPFGTDAHVVPGAAAVWYRLRPR